MADSPPAAEHEPGGGAAGEGHDDPVAGLGFDPASLARNPNLRALAVIAIVVAALAVIVGFGWH